VKGFELVEPRTLEEAVSLLDPTDANIRPIAGGTALMLMMKARLFQPTRLVSLRLLNHSFRGIRIDEEGAVHVGAMTALTDIEHSAVVGRTLPVLRNAMRTLSNVRIRNVATIGGHLAHGDPHMDLPPILLTLGARLRAVSPRGERWIDIGDLFAGYYQTTLAGDELIAELIIPAQPANVHAAYVKFTALSADDWPAVGVAAWYREEAGAIVEARVAVGAATERPLRLAGAEGALVGSQTPPTAFAAAADAAAGEVEPITDLRGTAAYKREMVRVHVRRALEHARKSRENR
jgi:aerobic carbon-monoxide dehydrogenase medium subunit